MARETAAGDLRSRRPAPARLPSSSAVTNTRMASIRSMIIPHHATVTCDYQLFSRLVQQSTFPSQPPAWKETIMSTNKVALITGASQGIGAGLVQGFRDRGYRVVANSRSIKPSDAADLVTVAGDIADPVVARRVVDTAIERFGRIDTLVNNAG